MSATTYKPIATMITCREDDQDAMVMLSEYRELERENAGLRELVSTLGIPSHVNVPWEKWKSMRYENAALRAKVAAQGLSLVCLADGILGEEAADRSDQTLVRVGCQLAGEVAALRADKERLDWMQNGGNAVDDVLYDMNVQIDFDVRAAIDAAIKEEQP